MRPFGKPQQLEARRRKAIALLAEGNTTAQVAERVKASTRSVNRWKQAYASAGNQALTSKPASGRPPRLSKKQKEQLVKILLRGARAAGYANDLWTCPRIAEVIEKRFGATYHVDYVGTLLHALGWSPQKPEHRAREQDEGAIARWRREEWPRIKKGARAKS